MRPRPPELEVLLRKLNDTPIAKVAGVVEEAFDLATRLMKERIEAKLPLLFAQIWNEGELGAKAPPVLAQASNPPPRRAIAGSYTEAVREALFTFATDSEGVDADRVLAKIRYDNPLSTVNVDRVRGVLKVLARSGEAYRTGRGKYKPVLKPDFDDGSTAYVQH